MAMEVIFLGTGTSVGVPVIGCNCDICTSNNPKDKRTRPGILLIKDDYHLLIDASQELRIQLLRENINKIDSIIITHPHADHIFGLDDTRIFTFKYNQAQKIYCSKETEKEIRHVYSYVFNNTQKGGGKPSFEFFNIENTKKIGPFLIESFKVYHGKLLIDAVIIDNLCIILDASYIDIDVFNKIKGKCEFAIINGLRLKLHSTHFTYSESAFLLKALGVKHGYIMHVSHTKKYKDFKNILPNGIEMSYDSLRIYI